jgi:hypothetical protein
MVEEEHGGLQHCASVRFWVIVVVSIKAIPSAVPVNIAISIPILCPCFKVSTRTAVTPSKSSAFIAERKFAIVIFDRGITRATTTEQVHAHTSAWWWRNMKARMGSP